MASAMAQPFILPNSVSSDDWSAAETNLDIVLIQFYRCKLCHNKFSSLSRSVVLAHMIKAHEPEWKAACENVNNLKSRGTPESAAEKISDGKKHDALNKPGRQNISITPARHKFAKNINGDTMVPRDTHAMKPWKKPAEFKQENILQNKKRKSILKSGSKDGNAAVNLPSTGSILSGLIFSTNLKNGIPEGVIISSCLTKSSIPDAIISTCNLTKNIPSTLTASTKNIPEESIISTCLTEDVPVKYIVSVSLTKDSEECIISNSFTEEIPEESIISTSLTKNIPEGSISSNLTNDVAEGSISNDLAKDVHEQSISNDLAKDIAKGSICTNLTQDVPEGSIGNDLAKDVVEGSICTNLTQDVPEGSISNDLAKDVAEGLIINTNFTKSISSGPIISTSQLSTPGLAVLSVKSGIAYVTHLNQPVVNLGKSIQIIPNQSEKSSEKQPPASKEDIICKVCGYVCSSWNEHWSHSHEHLPTYEKIRYQCQGCKLNFASEYKLDHHQDLYPECQVSETGADRPVLKCVLCSFETHSSQSLKIHIGAQHKQSTSDVEVVYCFVCNAKFSSIRGLRRHRQDGKCGRTKRGRPKGIKVKTKPRTPSVPQFVVCDLCNKSFNKFKFSDHYATHFDERKHKCKECDKLFKTKRAIRQHMVVHKGVKFSCDLCDFKAFWSDSIKKHKRMKHFSENLPYHACSICTYKTKDPSALKHHQKYTHREEKDYICETCGKSFKFGAALKAHQQTHIKKPQFPCNKCSFVANTHYSLYSHKSVHITKEEMRYKCDQCSWTGRRINELTRHKRKHSEDKTFYCHHCGLGYKHKQGLARHLKEKHMGNVYTAVEMSEPDESNIYDDDIIVVAQVFEV